MRNVASRSSQHSKMLGQPASWHTVCSPSDFTRLWSALYSGPIFARVLIHSGLRSIGVSALRTSSRSSLRPSGAGAELTSIERTPVSPGHRDSALALLVSRWLPIGVDIFGALADPVRRSLLRDLAAEPRRVVDLAAGRPISRPAVSKHLRLLLDAGAVTVDRPRPGALLRARPGGARPGRRRTSPRWPLRPVTEHALDALETEVRRTTRERRTRSRPSDTGTDAGDRMTAHRHASSSTDGQHVLVQTRTFRAPIEDVWAAVTEPERLARWIGSWEGDPESGSVQFRMLFEGEDHAGEAMEIRVCEPPHRLHLTSQRRRGGLAARARPQPRRRRHHADVLPSPESPTEQVGSVGPGWEYYLDRLVDVETGADPCAAGLRARLLPGDGRALPRPVLSMPDGSSARVRA